MIDKINQVIHKLLDDRSGERRITDWQAFDAALSKESPAYKVEEAPYAIENIRLEPVENERGEKAFKLSCEAAGSGWTRMIGAEFLLERVERNKGLKAEEIKAEREADRSRGRSMRM